MTPAVKPVPAGSAGPTDPSGWQAAPASDPQVSPCTGVCVLDAAGDLCRGCARRADEIAGWGGAPPSEREQIWRQLPARRAAVGLTLSRLPWGPDQVLEHLRWSLASRSGTWVLGVPGGLAEFSVGADEPLELEVSGPVVSAVTPRGALRLAVPDGIRALGREASPYPTGDPGHASMPPGASAIDLVVADTGRWSTRSRAPRVVTDLGPDDEAIRPGDRGQLRFDLGLGSGLVRFCVRTGHPGLVTQLRAAAGRPWSELVADHGAELIERSPDRVVATALGRIEVGTPIPPPGGRSPEGPHTHLLAGPLSEGGGTWSEPNLAAGWTVAASWYPDPPEEPA